MGAGSISPVVGRPSIVSGPSVIYNTIFGQPEMVKYLPGGGAIAAISQDYLNTSSQNTLRAGLMMGIISGGTYNGMYAPSVIDVTQGALANGGTTITLTVAGATGLAARVGTTGNLSLTGGTTAGGVARTVTVAYSSIVTSTGVVTITSPTVNAVQTLSFTNSPSGTFELSIVDYNGVKQVTAPITYSATAATLVSNIQTAINAVIPQVSSVNQIVVSGTAVTAIALTWSGVNYTGTQPMLIGVTDDSLSAGNVSVTYTTQGVSGAFIAGSLVGAADGSQVPSTFIPDGSGVLMGGTTSPISVDFPWIAYAAYILTPAILPYYPIDAGLQSFIKSSLNGGPNNYGWTFSDGFKNIT
jgi:hypothetical protein